MGGRPFLLLVEKGRLLGRRGLCRCLLARAIRAWRLAFLRAFGTVGGLHLARLAAGAVMAVMMDETAGQDQQAEQGKGKEQPFHYVTSLD